jgi:hypothetical protein
MVSSAVPRLGLDLARARCASMYVVRGRWRRGPGGAAVSSSGERSYDVRQSTEMTPRRSPPAPPAGGTPHAARITTRGQCSALCRRRRVGAYSRTRPAADRSLLSRRDPRSGGPASGRVPCLQRQRQASRASPVHTSGQPWAPDAAGATPGDRAGRGSAHQRATAEARAHACCGPLSTVVGSST